MDTGSRNTAIDLIKAFAILGVIAIHMGARVLTQNTVGSFEWNCGLFWGTFFRASVPLFLMASGAIMLEPAKKLSLKKLYLHNIARIIAAMLVWGFAYKIYHLADESQLSPEGVWNSVKRLLLFDQEFHFYYMHMILIVYVFLPITRLVAERADKKLFQYMLAVWAVLAIIFPTVQTVKPFELLVGVKEKWIINMTYASVGYGLFGYYLKKYPLSFKTALLCFVAGFMIIFCGTGFLSHRDGILHELFLKGTSIGVCVYAVGIFSLFLFVTVNGFLQKLIVYISKASFCIYLSHMFILYIAEKFSITAMLGPAILTVPCGSVTVLVVCLVIYAIISKIPGLNRWII